jgi:hypothetical protein
MLKVPKNITDNWIDRSNLNVLCDDALLTIGAGFDYEIICTGADLYTIEFFIEIKVNSIVTLYLDEDPFPEYKYRHRGLNVWIHISKIFNPNAQMKFIFGNSVKPMATLPKFHKVKSYLLPNPFYKEESVPIPKNNDGRTSCFWCGSPTKQSPGYSEMYDICTSCGK